MFNKKMSKIARNSWKNSTFAPKCLFSYIETGIFVKHSINPEIWMIVLIC